MIQEPGPLQLFTEIRPRRGTRLYELAAEQIEERILSGQLSFGARLPSEGELGEQFRVSRTVVREAIKVLVDKGLVRPEPGRGTFVSRPNSDALVTSIDTILRIEQCTLADLLELRRMIEIPAAGLAATRASVEQQAAIELAAERIKQRVHSASEFVLADKDFHVAIARSTGNELTAAVIGALMELCWKLDLVPVQSYPNAAPYHQMIKNAILAGDAEKAKAAMAAHQDQIRKDLVAVSATLVTAREGENK